MFDHVLVGVDGAHRGRDATALARQLAAPDGRLTLAHISGTGLTAGRGAVLLLGAQLEDARALLERVGSSRRGLVGRVFQGNHTVAALNGAPCPVAMAGPQIGGSP